MASSLNKVLIEGILGIDAKKNDGDYPSIFFTLGSSQSWKDKDSGEWKSRMTWVPVVYSRSTSDKLVAALTKSTPVRVEGRLDSYQREVDGKPNTVVQIRADEIEFLPRFAKNEDGGGRKPQAASSNAPRRSAPQRTSRRSRDEDDDGEDESLWS